MPLYSYRCKDCDKRWDEFRPHESRNVDTWHFGCKDGQIVREFSTGVWDAPIGGIYNRVNRHWNEGTGPDVIDQMPELFPEYHS